MTNLEINWRRPELSDKQKISEYFKAYPSRSCERTFTNVYLWSRHYGVTFAEVADTIVFRSGERFSFAYPVGEAENVKRAIDVLTAYSEENGQKVSFYNVTPEQFEQMEAWYP